MGRMDMRRRGLRKSRAMHLLRYIKVVPCLRQLCNRIELVRVDGGYAGADLLNYVKRLWGWTGPRRLGKSYREPTKRRGLKHYLAAGC